MEAKMSEQMKMRPKSDLKLSDIILDRFKEKGGVYGVAMRKHLHGTNLYSKIKRCDNALSRIRTLLSIVDHDIEYKIVERKNGSLKK
jgi:hypothetical protein